MAVVAAEVERARGVDGHARWVRISHWILTLSVLTLAVTGFVILMAHPRLYWGEVGNDLTPALIELPISRNHQHGGWDEPTPFFRTPPGRSAPAGPSTSSIRTAGGGVCTSWPRWCLVLPGAVYLLSGLFGGHFRSHVWPSAADLAPRLRLARRTRLTCGCGFRARAAGRSYGVLQKCAYSLVRLRGGAADRDHRPGDVAGGDRGAARSCWACSAATSPPARSTSSPSPPC